MSTLRHSIDEHAMGECLVMARCVYAQAMYIVPVTEVAAITVVVSLHDSDELLVMTLFSVI